MNLTHNQKKYIKKHRRSSSVEEIAGFLKIDHAEIRKYLGEDSPKSQITTKHISLKNFLKNHWKYFLFLLFLILVTYTNALNNAFLSDDLAEIVHNPNISSFTYILDHPFGFIRPFLYWLAFHIGGLNQILFRLINLFFHIGSVFLVYSLFNLISSKKLALLVAGIFAVHPAIGEAVIWISGGMYPQYTFFFLLSFIFYLLSDKGKKYYLLSILTFLFSFMSHTVMPLSLFSIFLLWELCFGNLKKNWKKVLPFLFITFIYIVFTLSLLPERETTLSSVHYQEKGIDNIFLIIPTAISSYLELIFFPKILTLYHSELAFSPVEFGIRTILTLLFLIGILFSFKKNERSSSSNRFIFFWGSLFFIALAPTLTPFRLNWIVAERYLYLPLIGILAIIGFLIIKLSDYLKLKWLWIVILSILIPLLSARTIIRNIDWKNEDNLWIATGKTSPSSPNTHNNLGDVYGRQGNKQKALEEFQKAIELKPNYGDAYHNLANTYKELGQLDKALENYQNAIKYNPNLWQSYQNIAALYFQSKQYDLALENIQKALQINPRNTNLYINLGIIYLAKGDKEKAKEVFNQILAADPQNQVAKAGIIEADK